MMPESPNSFRCAIYWPERRVGDKYGSNEIFSTWRRFWFNNEDMKAMKDEERRHGDGYCRKL
jgi:hypothetical protein